MWSDVCETVLETSAGLALNISILRGSCASELSNSQLEMPKRFEDGIVVILQLVK
jgi:hypothetical protein